MGWFLYDKGLRHERVKFIINLSVFRVLNPLKLGEGLKNLIVVYFLGTELS